MSTPFDAAQLSFFDDPLAIQFREFHHANPHVYARLVELAREWKRAGNDKCSIDMLFHLLRWQYGIRTSGEQFVLNNSFSAHYARLIMSNEADLDGLFITRVSRADAA